jgi:hypothetical protein
MLSVSRKSKFEPTTPIVPKRYGTSSAPRSAVRMSRIFLAVIGILLVIFLILALLL